MCFRQFQCMRAHYTNKKCCKELMIFNKIHRHKNAQTLMVTNSRKECFR